ncbi:hypothetical protein J416_10281 [Gracilibacillus halophilus YIM-C55.5]|uniref:Ribosomal protein eL8/eL30/eS12/Gadd45 domain-containing protein n=1 Tax=Gracilibacillus halophilus YIM-C55.5 TaxID=1308866 RepID=N4W8F4_9BACI|nr:ribosomal L7Ae/L30e/S12e/Gadd45 family protein [Gracilibacillus halophilus]ENH96548.1 hypothetical protein J416_10281 [Gracilibacillus halophilus YIM-C55.5]
MGNEQRHLQLIGIANRAGKCTFGEEQIVKQIQANRSKLILIAEDIGKQTRKKLIDKSVSYHIPYRVIEDRNTLSHAVGKQGRVAISIDDEGFRDKLISLLDNNIRG